MRDNHDDLAYYFIWCVLIFVVVVLCYLGISVIGANMRTAEVGIKSSLLEFTCQELATGRVVHNNCGGFKLLFINGAGDLVETDRIRAALVSKGCISKEDSQFILEDDVTKTKIYWQ